MNKIYIKDPVKSMNFPLILGVLLMPVTCGISLLIGVAVTWWMVTSDRIEKVQTPEEIARSRFAMTEPELKRLKRQRLKRQRRAKAS
jgi:hypothetical protein